jgi:hypothetical protein
MSETKRASRLVLFGGIAFVVLLVFYIGMPNYVRSGPSKISAIANNLRQLDGAMQLWAIEHGRTGAVVVAEEDVAPYLRAHSNGWVTSVAGERYILKTLVESPEVELTREVEGRPKGSILRLSTNSDLEVILPKSR